VVLLDGVVGASMVAEDSLTACEEVGLLEVSVRLLHLEGCAEEAVLNPAHLLSHWGQYLPLCINNGNDDKDQ
jgi:hypothetical protein